MSYDKAELERILDVQRKAFLSEGVVTAEVRRSRVSRLALIALENIDALAVALSEDYGHRPAPLIKVMETSWASDIQDTLDHLEEWMAPTEVPGGFVQQKPKGVVGIVGAWNFPINLVFHPALEALAAGNRVMLNFPEFHVKTGALLAELVAKAFPEEEVVLIHGDLAVAQQFTQLRFDHLFFTGSPKVGSIVSQEAAKNLVPVTMELGGKNPVIVARDADLQLAATRIAATRMLNGGQICLCPDYVLVPGELLDGFVDLIQEKLQHFFPSYLDNPSVVSLVNARNYERVVGLIDDAVQRGAKKIVVAPPGEAARLPDPASRRIAPTLLLDVPETALIAHDEVFGPVLAIYPYQDLQEALDYIAQRPSPLGAYWYGEDSAEFRRFLDYTTSGGVTRNDGLVHASLPGVPFGGIGMSGSGAYHGKNGFDTFTHRRAVANVTQEQGLADALISDALFKPEMEAGIEGLISSAIAGFKARLPSSR